MACSERNLGELKKDYALLEKKYSLPKFEEMNQEFLIEGLADVESELLIKHIRRIFIEKLSYFSKFIEVILNPSAGGASLLIFSITKNLSQEDKKTLSEIYERLSALEIESFKREISFSEKEEAIFVKKIYSYWIEMKSSLLPILENIEEKWGNKSGKSEKSYFR